MCIWEVLNQIILFSYAFILLTRNFGVEVYYRKSI